MTRSRLSMSGTLPRIPSFTQVPLSLEASGGAYDHAKSESLRCGVSEMVGDSLPDFRLAAQRRPPHRRWKDPERDSLSEWLYGTDECHSTARAKHCQPVLMAP